MQSIFQIRDRASAAALKRQKRHIIEITANGENIPLLEKWSERWCTLPADFANLFRDIYEFEVKNDDIFVVTFPKCGTTWLQEITWLLLNNLNYDIANSVQLTYRSVFLDLSAIYNDMPVNTLELTANLTSPRFIKSHLPAHLLPKQIWQKKIKLIYCARNPKDVVASYYHFHKGLGTWNGDMNEFIEDFLNNDIMYTPFWPSVMDFWKMRNEPHIFFTTFEEMKRDLVSVVHKLCKFLERPELNPNEMQELLKHCSFDNMKENKCTNPTENIKAGHGSPRVLSDFQFMRRGIVGAYKDELSAENQYKLNEWIINSLNTHNVTLSEIFGDI